MTSKYYFYLLIFPSKYFDLLVISHITFKLSILSNHAKYPKSLASYYILPLFIILKSLNLTGQPAYLEKDDFGEKKIVSHEEVGLPKSPLALHPTSQTDQIIRIS